MPTMHARRRTSRGRRDGGQRSAPRHHRIMPPARPRADDGARMAGGRALWGLRVRRGGRGVGGRVATARSAGLRRADSDEPAGGISARPTRDRRTGEDRSGPRDVLEPGTTGAPHRPMTLRRHEPHRAPAPVGRCLRDRPPAGTPPGAQAKARGEDEEQPPTGARRRPPSKRADGDGHVADRDAGLSSPLSLHRPHEGPTARIANTTRETPTAAFLPTFDDCDRPTSRRRGASSTEPCAIASSMFCATLAGLAAIYYCGIRDVAEGRPRAWLSPRIAAGDPEPPRNQMAARISSRAPPATDRVPFARSLSNRTNRDCRSHASAAPPPALLPSDNP